MEKRNYSLTGPERARATDAGLVDAAWYQSPISRKRLKELSARRNGPAIRDTILWFALIGISGYLGYHFWGTWMAVPCFFVYGTLYGSTSDSRWHECGHRTAFRTVWMNDFVYVIASFMVLREPTLWRWSHARHHTDTIIVGRDPEIAIPRPALILNVFLTFFALKGGPAFFRKIIIHSFGVMDPDEADFVPEAERPKVYWIARAFVLIYVAVIAAAIWMRSILPLMYIGLPSFYGAWLMWIFGMTQHAGLAEDVLDHRLNCRTVYINPVFRFLYWQMNYHVEHHMYPVVPYHALRALHDELKPDMPPPYSSLWNAYAEIIPTVWRQAKDPSYYIRRPIPTPTEIPVATAPAA